MSHSGCALVWHVQPRVVMFPCPTHYRPSSVKCRPVITIVIAVGANSGYTASQNNADKVGGQTAFLLREHSIVVTVSVCLYVCLSASVSPEARVQSLPNFHSMLPMSVAQSSSGGVAICYVLPVLWMTSCLYTMARNRRRSSESIESAVWICHCGVYSN